MTGYSFLKINHHIAREPDELTLADWKEPPFLVSEGIYYGSCDHSKSIHLGEYDLSVQVVNQASFYCIKQIH